MMNDATSLIERWSGRLLRALAIGFALYWLSLIVVHPCWPPADRQDLIDATRYVNGPVIPEPTR